MNVTTDPEWRDLMEAWQSEAPEEAAPPPLSDEVRQRIRRKVRRHSFWLIVLAVCEIAVTVGVLAWMVFLLDPRQPVDLVALAGAVLLFGWAFYFTFRNRRGTWWPAAESTATFIDLSVERCRRKLRTLRFCRGFLAVEVAFMSLWGTWAFLSRPVPPPLTKWLEFFGFLALFSATFLAWGTWYKRKTLRELAEWEELRRSLG